MPQRTAIKSKKKRKAKRILAVNLNLTVILITTTKNQQSCLIKISHMISRIVYWRSLAIRAKISVFQRKANTRDMMTLNNKLKTKKNKRLLFMTMIKLRTKKLTVETFPFKVSSQ